MTDNPPTSTSGQAIVLDPTDPFLAHFALQHDLRERFRHTIEQCLDVMNDPEVENAEVFAALRSMLEDAIDENSLRAWQAEGRPLPWIDAYLGEPVRQFDEVVTKILSGDTE